MTEHQAFSIVDKEILTFINDKEISFSKESKSDWLVFEWRQLTWKQYDFECIIEIYPEIDQNENIESWTFYSAIYYDRDEKRYYDKTTLFPKNSIFYIAENIRALLLESYEKIIKKDINDIPAIQHE